MKRILSIFALALMVCAAASAAAISTTMTVRGSGALGGTAFSGTADLTGIGTNLPLSGTFSIGSTSYAATFVITVTSADKLNVTVTIPLTIIGGTGTATGQVTGGTGAYAGATGSFPSMPGSGSLSSGTTLTLTFSGSGTINASGGGSSGGPSISAVLNSASNTAGIAQGAIFIVKGSGLSPASPTYLSFDVPRPTTSNGVKITFTPAGGGTGTDALLVYLYNQGGVNQLAGILPSTVAPGTYNVTVTNGTVSSPFSTQVVASKVGLFTQDSSGGGLASVQNYISAGVVDLNRLTTGSLSGTTISPAKPGGYLLAYGTGLGAWAAGDNSTSGSSHDFSGSMTIRAIVGGVSLPVAYAGRAGYPGEDQINFALPANVATGCAVSFQLSVNGVLSNATTIAIAPDSGSSACVLPGYTTAQLQQLDQGTTITGGGFSIMQYSMTDPSYGTVKVDSISGAFTQLSVYQLASASQGNVSMMQQGSCTVYQTSGTGSASGGSATALDAGTVTITGPSGSGLTNTALTKTSNTYALTTMEGLSGIPGQITFTLPPGGYTLNGAGGTDVGTFTTSMTLPTPVTLTSSLPATVVRSNPLTLNWTGGNSSDLVEITGSSSTGSGASAATTAFICLTTAGARTFTVPASILTQLPASANGGLTVLSGTYNTTFTTQLKSNSSNITGYFGSFVGTGAAPAYQ